ncbi:hypothetical protein DOM22_14790 [Bdellovibrio sp. ZAP7]|uniref:hypothetical protein n=1 Tax=Bdellovibrio sp. ZAP7 TaxID=2231053 RepID=UPI00115C2439|nr:hypothetical protein [Bdellovibrio sp. ZAP7]QDK46342.1 hypothetical protein DOM22_14790 [Bdellovibrio sp. ZAP7]
MNASKILKTAMSLGLVTATTVAISACGGGGGGGGSVSTGNVYYTHDELAREFVKRAYTDAGVNLTLVKSTTNSAGYIVVDYHGNTQAVFIDDWAVGQDISSYIYSQKWYDVNYIGNGYYQDAAGYVYEETATSSKDLAKVTAMKQAMDINESAKGIQAQFGLSAERSTTLARLAVQLKNNPKSSMTDADYDAYTKEIIGSSYGQLKAAMVKQSQGDYSDVNALVEKAAQANGVGPEQVSQILMSLIAGN